MASENEKRAPRARGVTRRGFISTLGVGAVGAVTVRPGAAEQAPPADADGRTRITLGVNGHTRRLAVEPRWTLLDVLREKLGLTGTKPGCERGECGACTVLIDGIPRYACLTLVVEAAGREITTVEGLLHGEELGDVQQAFVQHDAFQCGYCTSGQIMAVEGLLRAHPDPSIDEIREGTSGNLCRCGAYPNIHKAARRAAELRRGGGR